MWSSFSQVMDFLISFVVFHNVNFLKGFLHVLHKTCWVLTCKMKDFTFIRVFLKIQVKNLEKFLERVDWKVEARVKIRLKEF